MADPLSVLPDDAREKTTRKKQPDWTDPMKATLVHEYFSDPDWIYERKLDGERALVFIKNGNVRLMSRNQKELNSSYPELVEAFEDQDPPALIADGEIVAFDGDVTSFSKLQGRMQKKDPEKARNSGIEVFYYLFDLMHLDGHDLTSVPLISRKQVLKKAITFNDPLRYTEHVVEDGEKYHQQACEKGWEGVIAKEAGSAYAHSRSKKWLKFKCDKGQEFVIVGFTDPQGSRKGFGALLIGYYDDSGDLRYAGKVGTGYNDDFLQSFGKTLKNNERQSPPVSADDDPPSGSSIHWVTPKYVGEVGFTEWTNDGKLRHPRFLGLRRDKEAKDVVREDKS